MERRATTIASKAASLPLHEKKKLVDGLFSEHPRPSEDDKGALPHIDTPITLPNAPPAPRMEIVSVPKKKPEEVTSSSDGILVEGFVCSKIPKQKDVERTHEDPNAFFWIVETPTECSSLEDMVRLAQKAYTQKKVFSQDNDSVGCDSIADIDWKAVYCGLRKRTDLRLSCTSANSFESTPGSTVSVLDSHGHSRDTASGRKAVDSISHKFSRCPEKNQQKSFVRSVDRHQRRVFLAARQLPYCPFNSATASSVSSIHSCVPKPSSLTTSISSGLPSSTGRLDEGSSATLFKKRRANYSRRGFLFPSSCGGTAVASGDNSHRRLKRRQLISSETRMDATPGYSGAPFSLPDLSLSPPGSSSNSLRSPPLSPRCIAQIEAVDGDLELAGFLKRVERAQNLKRAQYVREHQETLVDAHYRQVTSLPDSSNDILLHKKLRLAQPLDPCRHLGSNTDVFLQASGSPLKHALNRDDTLMPSGVSSSPIQLGPTQDFFHGPIKQASPPSRGPQASYNIKYQKEEPTQWHPPAHHVKNSLFCRSQDLPRTTRKRLQEELSDIAELLLSQVALVENANYIDVHLAVQKQGPPNPTKSLATKLGSKMAQCLVRLPPWFCLGCPQAVPSVVKVNMHTVYNK